MRKLWRCKTRDSERRGIQSRAKSGFGPTHHGPRDTLCARAPFRSGGLGEYSYVLIKEEEKREREREGKKKSPNRIDRNLLLRWGEARAKGERSGRRFGLIGWTPAAQIPNSISSSSIFILPCLPVPGNSIHPSVFPNSPHLLPSPPPNHLITA